VNDEPGIRSLGCRLGRTFLVCDRRPSPAAPDRRASRSSRSPPGRPARGIN